ncbi:amino acid transporter-like protein [Aaosphaeria arxii CBS 175.79]|uniref:Amino acid transporter-like protein n=1 Tax=Aaosphaeria arxii CBS 175.79 TaxID=1450172 RepID=A0A6A5X616_9PLEO|nr:amino acid transporter-like protein [Aaosphaeria arxii CBS 175.79]KAF2008287.1 amino acid transporter-like protein [Aaosphaeria arxii CBS 175.79]
MDTADLQEHFRSEVDVLKSVDKSIYSSKAGSSRTQSDEQLLARFGKKQQFKKQRNFNLLTVVALCTTISTLPPFHQALHGIQLALFNGGSTGIVISIPLVFLGVLMQALVVAELSSIRIPLSGGQYNWVAILASKRYSNFLSYFTGWILIVAWQAGATSVIYQVSNVIVTLAYAVHADTEISEWKVTLVFCAIIAFAVFVTTVLGRVLPAIESFAFVVLVMGFFSIIIVLAYLAPKLDSSSVFNNYFNGGEWASNGYAVAIGSVPFMYGFNGFDAGVHIAEEVQNAAVVIPKAIIITVIVYFVMIYSTAISVLYCFSLEQALTSHYSIPIIEVFQKVTKSNAGAAALVSLSIIMLIFGSIGCLTTGSRMLWAFAREEGVPLSHWIAKIERRSKLPLYSIGTTAIICVPFALIGLGSEAAFNAFTGLTLAAFYTAFIVAASTLLYRRLTTSASNLPWGPFRLGPLGIPITIISILYSLVSIVFSFHPPVAKVEVATFNWSLVVYLGVVFLSVVWWLVRAKHTYKGPKIEVLTQEWLNMGVDTKSSLRN